MTSDHHVNGLVKACLSHHRFQPQELLHWLACDVLADLGIRHKEPPPDDLRPWLFTTAGAYAKAVADHPFADILGLTYQELSSHGKRGAMGQFFSPMPLGRLMAAITVGSEEHSRRRPDGGLWRACEPACGSGALILALMEQLVEQHGEESLQHWSITAIDLDPLCARICAAQVMANLFVHRRQLGELVVYEGNALGPVEDLRGILHTTVADLSPDLVLPAFHPSRIAALRAAARTAATQRDDVSAASARAREAEKARRTVREPAPSAKKQANEPQVDLFAD